MNEVDNNECRLIIGVENVGPNYKVTVNEGVSVPEVAFAISVIIKVFNRDDVIKSDEMLRLIQDYLNDPQYEEVLN